MSFKSVPDNTKKTLELINTFPELFKEFEFYLAGGTSLALQIDHRISYDLDFFTKREFKLQEILNLLKELNLKDVEASSGTIKFFLEDCQISFFYYPYPVLEKFLYLSDVNSVPLASKLDIALMKITALADRGLRKDFVDLYFIAKQVGGLKEILKSFIFKFPEANYYHYMKSLTFFETADNDPELNMIESINWEAVKKYFIDQSKQLFN